MDKLTPDELSKYKTAQAIFNKAKTDLAFTVAEQDNLVKQKEANLVNFHHTYAELESVSTGITEKYGDVKVDMADGKIIRE